MRQGYDNFHLEEILSKAVDLQPLEGDDILFLLSLRKNEHIQKLLHTSRKLRRRFFGDNIFLYGFIYFTTFCRNDCSFCRYRRSNTTLPRYRKSSAEIVEAASMMVKAGVHLIDLTMGESPTFFHPEPDGFGQLYTIVRAVKQDNGTAVMVSPGVVPDGVLADLAAAGADWYACYQETHNRELFSSLRLGQDFDRRMRIKHRAKKNGLLVEEGILTGVGDSIADIAYSITAMRRLDADQVRVMTFVPQKGTPMADRPVPDRLQELIVIAVLRLVFPGRLIPASLDIDGLAGLRQRLRAGANVVTSLVFPGQGLSGVANRRLDVDNARRTPEAVLPVLKTCGLRIASDHDYCQWINRRKMLAEPIAPKKRRAPHNG